MNYSQAQTSAAPGKAIFINYPPIRAAWQARPDANVGNLNFNRQFVNTLLPLFWGRGLGLAVLSAGGPSQVSPPGAGCDLVFTAPGARGARGCLRGTAGKAASAESRSWPTWLEASVRGGVEDRPAWGGLCCSALPDGTGGWCSLRFGDSSPYREGLRDPPPPNWRPATVFPRCPVTGLPASMGRARA